MQAFTLFISDLHLSPAHKEGNAWFLGFLEKEAPAADALYILGDLFDVWIGDDDDAAFVQVIKAGLKTLVSGGTPVYFMQGHRDFLIGERFAEDTGVQLLPDPTRIDLYGEPVLLMHGDTLCTHDRQYLRARKYLRNNTLQRLFMAFPLRLRKALARRARLASQQHIQKVDDRVMDVSQEAAVRSLSASKARTLIHGHTHKPQMHHFTLEGNKASRCVLGAWHTTGNALLWQADGTYRFLEIGEKAPGKKLDLTLA